MKKVIGIVGPSASGKDTIVSDLSKIFNEANFITHCTTRPKRDGEVDGREYNFITPEEMYNNIIENKMIAVSMYRGWNYGLYEDSIVEDKINIGILNLTDIDELRYIKNIELYIIYVTASSKIRFIRSLKREAEPDISEIYRRYISDDEDFYWFEEDYKDYEQNGKSITIDTTNDNVDYKKIINFIDGVKHERI